MPSHITKKEEDENAALFHSGCIVGLPELDLDPIRPISDMGHATISPKHLIGNITRNGS